MLSAEEQQRYHRQIILPEIGMKGQLLLRAAKVLVIGAGGLGCPVLQYLVAAGVGTIGIADGDKIEISNLQRQILYTSQDIGCYKAETARLKLQPLNPFVNLTAYPAEVTRDNALSLIQEYDIVVDGTDNFTTRYLLNDACVLLNKPLVFGSIFKFEGQVSVFNYQDGPTYRCIFPEPPQADEAPNCAAIGVVASLPGIIGTLQANEVIKIITGAGEVLSGRLLVIDALGMHTQSFRFNAVAANKTISKLGDYAYDCETEHAVISYDELQQLLQKEYIQLIDVREPEEHTAFNIGGQNIPLGTLVSCYDQLNATGTLVLYCASGTRSNQGVDLLKQKGFEKVMSLQHGIRHLQAVWPPA
ncbi:MAG: molybdopterin-synthase adenylyltransferase MoeB [Sediminibacterium sp.]